MFAGLTYYEIIKYFLIYSFLGWCVEVVYQALTKGIVVNRGFLNGPVCPIYGFGVVGIFMLSQGMSQSGMENANGLTMFFGGAVFATMIELIGGFALDKIFHARWWDYSRKPFNFHGYICLEFSILWGLGIVFVVRDVHPFIAQHSFNAVPERTGWLILGLLCTAYAADLVVSVMIMVGLNRRLAELDELQARMRVVSNELSRTLGEGTLDAARHVEEARLQASLAKAEVRSDFRSIREEFELQREALRGRIRSSKYFGTGRLLRAFPDMEHRDYKEILDELRNH